MTRLMKLFFGVLALTVLSVPFAEADIYGYRDSKGILHLSNTPSRNSSSDLVLKERHTRKSRISTREQKKIKELIRIISLSEGIDPDLVESIAYVESAFNPKAVSPRGAVGVMQLMPETAKRFKVKNIYVPEENIRGGVRYLKYLKKLFPHDLRLALAAYNAGENRVLNVGRIPDIDETKNYVKKVLNHYQQKTGKTVKSTRPVRRFVDKSGNLHLSNL